MWAASQKGVDVNVTLKGQVEGPVVPHAVDVSPSLALAVDVPSSLQVSDDALCCSLGDVEQYGDFPYSIFVGPGR